MIAEKLIQAVELRLDGTDWPILLTHDVLIGCDRLTGGSILSGVNFCSARLVRTLLYLALRRARADYSIEQVGTFIHPRTVGAIHEALQQAWIAAMPESDEDDEDEDQEEGPLAKPLTWPEAYAIARFDLDLSFEEWLDMTPGLVHHLRKRQLVQMQREEVLTGVLAAAIVNFSWCHPKQTVSATEFMLHPYPEEPLPPVTGEMMKAAFASVLGTKFQIIKES